MPVMDEPDINGNPASLKCVLVCIFLEIGRKESAAVEK